MMGQSKNCTVSEQRQLLENSKPNFHKLLHGSSTRQSAERDNPRERGAGKKAMYIYSESESSLLAAASALRRLP
jgi:hypothetical protein